MWSAVLPRNEHTESCTVLVRLPGYMVVMWSAVLPRNEHTESCTVLVRLPGHTRGVQKVRGPTKKENEFYNETRCEGCDVIKTTPDAATSQSVLLLCAGCWLL